MDDTRYQFPSVTVSRKYDRTVNPELIARYEGEARKLLYELKNLMKFRNLGQLRMTRFFMDGTVITAWSIFGQDFIDIKTAPSDIIKGFKECTLTLIDLPSVVQPMRYPKRIETDEKSGIDYIKTYYVFDVSKCYDCNDIQVDFLFKYDIPEEPRHYFDPIEQKPELDNHCVWSWQPPCWGQIIERGTDIGGHYFIWKAFTEFTDHIRNGLGVLLLGAKISDGQQVICSFQQKIDVDCCHKNIDLRKVEIWWENPDVSTCEQTIGPPPSPLQYHGLVLCKFPPKPIYHETKRRLYPLIEDLIKSGGMLYAIPEENGGCLPFTWSLTGPGSLEAQEESFGFHKAHYSNESHTCRDELTITLEDRCETRYEVTIPSCCGGGEQLSISYTSLVMGCNQQQTLLAEGGCEPYTWTLVSGGGTLGSNTGRQVNYTSPATNPNCVNNPIIQVTDCCGSTAQIKLAINCVIGNAGYHVRWAIQTQCLCRYSPTSERTIYYWDKYRNYIYCDGTESGETEPEAHIQLEDTPATISDPVRCVEIAGGCTCPYPYSFCYCCTHQPGCPNYVGYTRVFCAYNLSVEAQGTHDTRTSQQKQLGCCPPQFL